MKVEMLVGLSGPTFTLESGDKREFPQDEAVRLIAAGYAIPVAEREIERAIVEPVVETRGPDFELTNYQNKKKRR